MKITSSGKTRRRHQKHKRTKKKRSYVKYPKRLKKRKSLAKLREVFKELKDKGNKIAGYGAPAKSSTLINSIGLTNETIDYIVEDSRLKQGLVTPGSKIPIVDSNMLETNKPDYLVIFAWNYADEIIRKIEDKYQKFNYIIPMPELKIIQNSKH